MSSALTSVHGTIRGQRLLRAAFAMNPKQLVGDVFGPTLGSLADIVDLDPGTVLTEFETDMSRNVLAGTEVLLTGWGCPPITVDVVATMENLVGIFHFGGAIAHLATPDAMEALVSRGVALSNAGEANAIPVAEFTFASILLANKRARESEVLYRHRRAAVRREESFLCSGNYGTRVGIIGASRIGRRVLQFLRQTDVEILLSDPYISEQEANELGAQLCPLPDLMGLSDTVSLHVPLVPSTESMITEELIGLLRDGATFINTSRGEIVDQDALVRHLSTGRINAVLDVTTPDVLAGDHPLWDLSNVTLTPHMAGSTGNELHRLGTHVAEEVARLRANEKLRYPEVAVDG